jgi:uncharacterized protein YbbC (DUF1343 family)
MEACAENNIELIFRQTMNGNIVDGQKFTSFVGMHPIPVYALFANIHND